MSVQANEVTYELHTLGWKAFQNLCATITGEVWGQTIQTFFDVNDGGRDGAFHGDWDSQDGDSFKGSFTVQCKFTAAVGSTIKLSELREELDKAERLAKEGLSDNYFLFTNAKLTGANEEKIKNAFLNVPGINGFAAYGRDRISIMIRESSRLRMLVPRVYGLGDLSQILDVRAYDQAVEILSSLGDDLQKFVPTAAYKQSAKALIDHGFVLLLGDPMCGKSTIAAALAVGAIDEWECSTIKVRDADDFVSHFNPHEKQFFWVDDAFGPTQIDFSSVFSWNKTLPHVAAAINRGSKVLFTSRNYIYKSAKKYLKEASLPILKDSQVIINVEDISETEKEQILYNHIKLGNQPVQYKQEIKPLLPNVVLNAKFSPEIARRLASTFFTRDLKLTKYHLADFVEKPLELLCEIINSMDDNSRSALAVVFMRGGVLPSSLSLTESEENAIAKLGGSLSGVVKELDSLDENLLINSIKDGEHFWHFKHPTVRDAFASIVAENQSLMDIYLTGASLEKLFSEIACGSVEVQGVSVVVPQNQFNTVIDRLKELTKPKWHERSSLYSFLSHKCDKAFLQAYIDQFPNFVSNISIGSYLGGSREVNLVSRLKELGLLAEADRERFGTQIANVALNTPDSGFLSGGCKTILTTKESACILVDMRETLIPRLDEEIEVFRTNYEPDEDPEWHFSDLKNTLDDLLNEFEGLDDECSEIETALDQIDHMVSELKIKHDESLKEEDLENESTPDLNDQIERSIFEDVDV
jgi:hypothetical protein